MAVQIERDALTGRWAPMHGLYVKRPRTCPCGAVFAAETPTATYCGDPCRVAYTRYGNPGSLRREG